MKVIDLLNKIANGEAPKKVFYKTGGEYTGGYYWNYDEGFRDYKDKAGDYVFNAGNYHVIDMLNMEVEIIEEDKKIEEINMFDYFTGFDYGRTDEKLLKDLEHNFETLNSKINEIIDYLEKEK